MKNRVIVDNCLLIIMLMLTISVSADVFRVGYYELPPHGHANINQYNENLAIDYFKLIAEEMEIEFIEFKSYPLTRLRAMLKRNEIDMILYMDKHIHRDIEFVFSEIPLINTSPVIAIKKHFDLNDVNRSKILRIGAWQEDLNSLSHFLQVTIDPLSSENVLESNIKKLQNDRLDGVYSPDTTAIKYEIMKKSLQNEIKLVRLYEDNRNLYSVFSKESAEKYLENYQKSLITLNEKLSYDNFLIRNKVLRYSEINDEFIKNTPANVDDISKEYISGVYEIIDENMIILNIKEVLTIY